jgi:hypothetical protein
MVDLEQDEKEFGIAAYIQSRCVALLRVVAGYCVRAS